MIVVENILSNKDRELLFEFTQSVKDKKFPETSVVVFWQGEAIGKTKEAKELNELLSKERFTYRFGELSEAELRAWVGSEIKKRKGKIGGHALEYLTNCGLDMWSLSSLLDQLASYKAGAEIQLSDVELFLDDLAREDVFGLVDAIVSGNRKLAFKLLNEQRRAGVEDFRIFSLIAWQFRSLIQIRDVFEREDKITSDEIAKRVKLHPFVVKKSLPTVKRFSLARLKFIHEQLLVIDEKVKTGQGDLPLLIEMFIYDVGEKTARP